MNTSKTKRQLTVFSDHFIRELIFTTIAPLLISCAHQIEMGNLSAKYNKESLIEKLNSPAYQAKIHYKENYSESEDESDKDVHENCSVSLKHIRLSNNSEPYKTSKETIDKRQWLHDPVLARK